ncbi:MAG: hypothetical protein OXK77_06210 [Gemmatimonadota bacterium]|nr:hypothetical protein [Gemmatimonadota bacterium]MDE2865983.1 hypothetical protein [Gemmatimonadota bacterium]
MSKKPIDFKDPIFAHHWLDTAISFERRKLAKSPVLPDLAPGHEAAQGWAYVVAGYFLLEQALKLLLHLRSIPPARTHALSSELYDLLPDKDRDILREYYRDYREACDHAAGFPFRDLDRFLSNLDGQQNSSGRFIGSFDWRYYLIEKMSGASMPIVSIDILHEIVYGATCIIEYLVHDNFEPSKYTYSHRMHWPRQRKYLEWIEARINTPGLKVPENGLEILWGPDYRGRYDFLIHCGQGQFSICFGELPEDQGRPVDKRSEVEAFSPG